MCSALIVSLILLFALVTTTTHADVPRPIGVPLSHAALYKPQVGDSWTCLDNSKTIAYVQINDDFCDCKDGSDEPGTAACPQGRFHCENLGHRPLSIPSSRINDGICDCCDGSDEKPGPGGATRCPNNCQELGRTEMELRKNEADLLKRGAAKRAEMIAKGKQLRTERNARRAELDARRIETEALKAEKEMLKKTAEAAEAEALEVYKVQQRADEANQLAAAGEATNSHTAEAEESFKQYDTNGDGFVDLKELQLDIKLDRDHNGVVDELEAKYFLDERESVALEDFVAYSWPRIKTISMLAEGLFKPPMQAAENNAANVQVHVEEGSGGDAEQQDTKHEEQEEGEEEEETEEGYEDDADTGVGTVTQETLPGIEYDAETQSLIETANVARNAFTEVERQMREIEQEIKDIDAQNEKDFGFNEEYAAIDGECFRFEDREYVYTLCPFDRASQKQRSGGAETTLGRWDQWITEGKNKYAKQKYSNGASCWNGPQRSAIIHLKCALEHRLTAVAEPNRCEYAFEFETPAACHQFDNASDGERLHDEL